MKFQINFFISSFIHLLQQFFINKNRVKELYILTSHFINKQYQNPKNMSVFRIQRKKTQTDSRHKIHSQQSRTYFNTKNNNLAQLLLNAHQRQKQKLQIKKRVFTIEGNQDNYHNSQLKKISQAYNINLSKKEYARNLRSSKKSFSGDKGLPQFQMKRKSQNKIFSFQGIARSSPKLQAKVLSQQKKTARLKVNASNQVLQKRKKQFVSLNSSIISKSSTKKIHSNRVVSNYKRDQIILIFDQAVKQYKNKNTLKSLQLFKQILKNQPQNIQCMYYIGSCYLNIGQNEKSIKYLNQLKSINSAFNCNMYLYLAINFKILNKMDDSIQVLEQCLKIFPNYEEGYFYLAKLQIKKSKIHKAIKSLERTIELNSTNSLAKICLADCLTAIGKQEKSIQLYKEVLYPYQKGNCLNQNYLNSPIAQKDKLDIKVKKTTHLKLIKLLIKNQLYEDHYMCLSVEFLQQSYQKNPQFIFYQSLIKYQTQPNTKIIQQIKTNLQLLLSQNLQYWIMLEVIKLLLKIFVNNKDMYECEEVLKRSQRHQVKRSDLIEWVLFIEGANDIIKRKYDDGKQKLEECLDVLDDKMSKGNEIINSTRRSQVKSKNQDQFPHLSLAYLQFIKFYALQYLAYVYFIFQKYQKSLQIYRKLMKYFKHNSTIKTQRQQNHLKVNPKQPLLNPHGTTSNQTMQQIQLNQIVLQSLIHHKLSQNFQTSKHGFQHALTIQQRPQILFMWIINQIAILKYIQTSKQQQQQEQTPSQPNNNYKQQLSQFNWRILSQRIIHLEYIAPRYSLIFFYHSLLNLYLLSNAQALQKVQKAIQTVDQPVSQYHFIQALCYFLLSEQMQQTQLAKKGRQAIDKAIEIDSSIPQFYKQRSKHLFCLQKYQQSIKDCQLCQRQSGEDDQQVKLLCMFYYYTNENYKKSESLLKQLILSKNQGTTSSDNSIKLSNQSLHNKNNKYKKQLSSLVQLQQQQKNQHKYKQFQQALMFRLGKFNKTGLLSKMFIILIQTQQLQNKQQLDSDYLTFLNELIQNRNQYSQFTIYFMNLLMSAYSVKQQNYSQGLNYLFSCLEEIQSIVDEKNKNVDFSAVDTVGQDDEQRGYDNESNNRNIFGYRSSSQRNKLKQQLSRIDTDMMLNQIKYNIVVATLMKNMQSFRKSSMNKDKTTGQQQQQQQSHEQEYHQTSSTTPTKIYHQTLTFLQTFIKQSQSQQLIQNLQVIKKLIHDSFRQPIARYNIQPQQQAKHNNNNQRKHNDIFITLKPFIQIEKYSDLFPFINIQIGQKYTLTTKFIVFYPPKLKFNIKPQFDPSFLFNFDMDKIQNKLLPPWFKFTQNKGSYNFKNNIIFTDQIRNQSLKISQTERQPSILENPKIKSNRYHHMNNESERKMSVKSNQLEKIDNLKNIIKLDSMIEKKLKKLFPK